MMTDDRISILKGAPLCIQMNLESPWLAVCLPLPWGQNKTISSPQILLRPLALLEWILMTSYGHCSSDYLINSLQCLVPKEKKEAVGGMDMMCLLALQFPEGGWQYMLSRDRTGARMAELTQYSMNIEIQVSDGVCLCMSNSREE